MGHNTIFITRIAKQKTKKSLDNQSLEQELKRSLNINQSHHTISDLPSHQHPPTEAFRCSLLALDSSATDLGDVEPDQDTSGRHDNLGKVAYTIWTTSKTTSTITVLYTNTASTVKISYYCVAGGVQYPSVNC